MRIEGAMTVLRKEAEFLGMTMDELFVFIERNPYAVKCSTIDAYKVYIKEAPHWPPHILEAL